MLKVIRRFFFEWRADWAKMSSLEKNAHYGIAVIFLFAHWVIIDRFAAHLAMAKESELAIHRDIDMRFLLLDTRPGTDRDVLQAWVDCAKSKAVAGVDSGEHTYVRRSTRKELEDCHRSVRTLFVRRGVSLAAIDAMVDQARRRAP
ncbi:hypothetical protein [Xanthomonas euvesicatoria]|uniref:hypothetical protein n=1 Tax=Xanthomonas euvesicatoria TaxID=456327 RepID=UPI003557A507